MSQLDNIFATVDREYERNRIVDAYSRRHARNAHYTYFDRANQLLLQERELHILDALVELGFADLASGSVLDIGCGDGYFIRQFIQWGAHPENIVGVDLLTDRVMRAHRLCPPASNICFADASDLPFEDDKFDIVIQATMLSSVLNEAQRGQIAHEMLRVLRPGGAVLSYDFFINNPRNRDVRRLTLEDLRTLFPGRSIRARRLTLAPPLGRAVAPLSRLAYRVLSSMKIFSTHYLAVIRKP